MVFDNWVGLVLNADSRPIGSGVGLRVNSSLRPQRTADALDSQSMLCSNKDLNNLET